MLSKKNTFRYYDTTYLLTVHTLLNQSQNYVVSGISVSEVPFCGVVTSTSMKRFRAYVLCN